MEQGKIMEAEAPTVRVGATPAGLTAPHSHNPPSFLQARYHSFRPTNSVKALKAREDFSIMYYYRTSQEDGRWT